MDILDRLQSLIHGNTPTKHNLIIADAKAEITRLTAEVAELRKDAERFKAIAKEFDDWQPNKARPSYLKVMPIWDVMCDAIGDGADGNALREAIDAAIKSEQKESEG